MIAVDTSVAVAALVAWHESHAVTRASIKGASIPVHALTETYSVLTRLPQPLAAADAAHLLTSAFPRGRILVPPPALQRSVPTRCASLGIWGGATYDAVIALTALHHDTTLVTRDRRAARTYERVGVRFRLL